MRFRAAMLALTALAAAATAAERPMTGAEFDAYSRGKTFYYGAGGQAYGVEEYLDDRRVRWSFLDGKCKDGRWYEQGDLICFVYDDEPDAPQCWSFFMGSGGLVARFQNDPQSTTLYEVENSEEPMMCHGPEIGV